MPSQAPFIILFSSFLVMGSFISISSSNWIFLWLGLEINLFSIIPLMTFAYNSQETESALKYFLIQAGGSGALLLGLSAMTLPPSPNTYSWLLVSGLLIKLGIAPFHSWLPQVMAGQSWPMCFVLTTWQKVAPIALLMESSLPSCTIFIIIVASMSTLAAGLGGMNQTQLRPLLAYSSIGHMGWMLAAMSITPEAALLYFVTYCFISACIISVLILSNQKPVTNSSLAGSIKASNLLIICTLLLSLGGVPPLLGFMPKWFVLNLLIEASSSLLPLMLVIGSLMNLFYYLSAFFFQILTLLRKNSPSMEFGSSSGLFLIVGTATLPLFQTILSYALTLLNES